MTKDVQTIETSSHLSIASRIDSEIKSFKEKREDFINYLQILQSEIKGTTFIDFLIKFLSEGIK